MVGFVILNYNSWKFTSELAKKLSLYKKIDLIVVVDNRSTDDSYSHLKKLNSEKINVIQSEKNGGYSYGNNIGAKLCKEKGMDIIFICNPDVMIAEQDLDKIINSFNKYPQYAMLSGVEYNLKNEISQPPVWKMNNYWDDLFECSFIYKILSKKISAINLDKTKEIQEIEIQKGSFFGIRTKDYFNVGCFDEGVFLFCEERILARRFKENGYKIGLVTDAKYNHNHSESINRTYKKKATQMKLLYNSIYYYNVKYNKIGFLKKIMLKIAMKISCFEFSIRDMFGVLKLKIKKGTRC